MSTTDFSEIMMVWNVLEMEKSKRRYSLEVELI